MSINLIESVQEYLGYAPLRKIDPNTQTVSEDTAQQDHDKFGQAAIPAVLTALYKYVKTDDQATSVLNDAFHGNWVEHIFADNTKPAVQSIAAYSKQSSADPVSKLNEIADASIKIVSNNLPAEATIKDLKQFIKNQKTNILLYLPTDLNMGELLHDATLDDNTNKMEGPISTLMNKIGNAFSTSENKE